MTRPVKVAGRALVHRVGRRGAFLAFLAILDYLYAVSLWPFQVPRHITLIVSPKEWAAAWFVVALACTVGVFLRRDRVPYSIAAAIKACWSALYFHLWLVQHFPDAWVSAVVWLTFALIVVMVSSWPDPILTGQD